MKIHYKFAIFNSYSRGYFELSSVQKPQPCPGALILAAQRDVPPWIMTMPMLVTSVALLPSGNLT